MCMYYVNMNFVQKSCIYSSMSNDYFRYIITRWRLSNHNLKIETGRYTKPLTCEERICGLCHIIEDEYHVIFICPIYELVRVKYRALLSCDNISKFLNPELSAIKDTACFLHEIENVRKEIE